MRRLTLFALLVAASALVTVAPLIACGDTAPEPARLQTMPGKDAGKSDLDAADPMLEPDTSVLPDGASAQGFVYAHTPDTLYLYEPVGNTLKPIGKFDCINPAVDNRDVVTDIAVDRTGHMFASTFDRVLTVDPITAHCTELAFAGALDPPNSLSFVPAGTVDPTKEALVGYASNYMMNDTVHYVRIDTDKGTLTEIGNMNATTTGPQYRSSGDMISVIQDGNRSYATVKLTTDAGAQGTDLLAEIDPATGHIKRIIGDTKQNNLYGFGYWAGKGYGFSDLGRIIEVDMANGNGVVVKTLTSPEGGVLPWYGAGVTTQAPTQ